jgi:hypothetical protein
MRILLRSFAFLDFIALFLMGMQLWVIWHRFNEIAKLSEKISSVLMFPMFLLLAAGAVGLWFFKKMGFILYYIQFPFRLYLWVFTIGFIALLPEAFGRFEDYWFNLTLKICIVAEFIRLYLTIKMQLNLKRLQ